jgi:hypothetical protein
LSVGRVHAQQGYDYILNPGGTATDGLLHTRISMGEARGAGDKRHAHGTTLGGPTILG